MRSPFKAYFKDKIGSAVFCCMLGMTRWICPILRISSGSESLRYENNFDLVLGFIISDAPKI